MHSAGGTLAFGDLGPGAVIERYEIAERLRDEGAAVVFRARHLDLGRLVALSVLRPAALEDDARARERFRESARLVARLEHPAIAPIYSLGELDDTVWVASRLLVGTTLDEAAREGLTPAQTAHIVRSLADALQEIHDAGVVHRDLRPDNVWLVRGHAPLIGAPGVRRSDGRTRTSTGLLLGSAQYLAPEQILGESAARSSDVFSLGAVTVTCLTGEHPYPAKSLGWLLSTRPLAPTPSLELRGKRADALNEVLARMMDPDPARRPESPVECAEAIAAAIGTLPSDVREGTGALAVAPQKEREPGAAAERAVPVRAGAQAEATAEAAPAPAGVTRVDRQRPALEPAAEDKPTTPRWQIAAVAVALLALPVLCFLAGRTLAGPPASDVRAGDFVLRIDDRWSSSEKPPPSGVGAVVERPAVLEGPHQTLAVTGALTKAGPSSDPLRPIAADLLSDEPDRRVLRFGARQAVVYDGGLPNSTSALRALVVPTTRRPLVILCVGATSTAAVADACDALAAHAQLGPARPVPAQPDPATAAALAKVLNEMHNRVELRQIELDEVAQDERARALVALHAVYRLALEELRALRVPAHEKPVVAELGAALERVVSAYEAFGSSGAETASSRRGAEDAVQDLRRVVRELDTLGYAVADEAGGA